MPDRETVLIAEDDLTLLRALTVRLESAGYHVIPVQDGYQALEQARRNRPDVLLMDVNMPAGSGLSVQERMNHLEELQSIPVVYMTGDTSDAMADRADDLGAFALLNKPLDSQTLLSVLKAAINASQRARNEAA